MNRKYVFITLFVLVVTGWILRFSVVKSLGYGNYTEWSQENYFGGIHGIYLSSGEYFVHNKKIFNVNRLPGYSIFMSLFFDKDRDVWVTRVRIAQITIDALAVLLVYWLGMMIFARSGVSILAAAGYAYMPVFVIQSGFAMAEALSPALFLIAMLLIVASFKGNKIYLSAVTGVVIAVLFYVRGEFFVMPFFVVLLAIPYSLLKRNGFRVDLLKIGLLFAGFIIVYSWWPIRNYQKYGHFIPTTTCSWNAFWEPIGCVYPDNPMGALCDDAARAKEVVALGLVDGSYEANEYWKNKYFKAVKEYPGFIVKAMIKRMFMVVRSSGLNYKIEDITGIGAGTVMAMKIALALLSAASILYALILLLKNPDMLFVFFPMFFIVLLYGLTHYEPRYVSAMFITHILCYALFFESILRKNRRADRLENG